MFSTVRRTMSRYCSCLATERDQALGVTVVTAHPQETVLQATTPEIVLKFALHVVRQRPVARGRNLGQPSKRRSGDPIKFVQNRN